MKKLIVLSTAVAVALISCKGEKKDRNQGKGRN